MGVASVTSYIALVDGKPGNYGIVIPDLPGCYSAAKTLDEVVLMAAEAIGLWVEATRAAGRAVPPPRTIEELRADPALAESFTQRRNIVSVHIRRGGHAWICESG